MRIGIDLGGTKIEGVALDRAGKELMRQRVPTPRDYEASVEAIATLVTQIESVAGEEGTVGIGIPGEKSTVTGLVKNANSTWLIGRALDRDLEQRLARPIRMMNDANCFTLSEATDGAAAGAEVVFGVILGTGVGGGVVVDGRCRVGANRIGGEWGHNPLPWPSPEEGVGPECYCGKHGCIETYLSGPGLANDHATRSGKRMSTRDIVQAAQAGEMDAMESLLRYHDRLGRGLATVINILDPEVVVLGGGMSNLPGLAEAARESVARYLFSDSVATRIVLNAHGDSSGVRGAAWLWPG